MDHLTEYHDYYTKLEKMEKTASVDISKAVKSFKAKPGVKVVLPERNWHLWTEPSDSDDAFPPAVKSYEVVDGWVYYQGRNGSEGIVVGSKDELFAWAKSVDGYVQKVVQAIQEFKRGGGANFTRYHALSSNFEGAVEAAVLYVFYPDKIKAFAPPVYEALSEWFNGRRVKLAMQPRPSDRNKVFYHGTSTEQAARAIWVEGLNPRKVIEHPKSQMSPVQGRVYLTPDIAYAQVYALGGDRAGGEPYAPDLVKARYGYVAVVFGTSLYADVQPDEDSIGEMLAHALRDPRHPVAYWLVPRAKRVLTPRTLQKVREGEYAYWAQAGKKLVKTLSSYEMGDLIDHGAHVAHAGSIHPTELWRLDKGRTLELKKDGSTFFQVAELVHRRAPMASSRSASYDPQSWYYNGEPGLDLDTVIQRWQDQRPGKDQRGNPMPRQKLYDDDMPLDILIRDLWPYREYTWTREHSRPDTFHVDGKSVWMSGEQKWDALVESMKKRGWDPKYPLYFYIGKDGGAKVGEGNHRLAVARQLGISKAPVVFYFQTGRVQKSPSAIRVAARYQEKKNIKTQKGEDASVYVYSERQVQNRNRDKAKRVEKLRGNLDKLRTQVKKDLEAGKTEKSKTWWAALAVLLIDCSYERVGNPTSADDGHFGVTGWKKEHVTFEKNKAVIRYVGKSGVKQEKHLDDPVCIKILREAVKGKKPNDEVVDCGSEDVNEYLKPFGITAKDIRGFHANREVQERLTAIRSKGGKLPEDKKEREKKLKEEFKEALEGAAEAVGHDSKTLQSFYLVPNLEGLYTQNGTVIKKFTD